jgi:hypothetical protein
MFSHVQSSYIEKHLFFLHTKTTPIVTNVGSMVGHVK